MTSPKILIWDIETSPHLLWSFQTSKISWISPDQIVQPTRMICFAAKWYGEKKIIFRSEYHHDRDDMVRTLHQLLDEADATVTYNGDKFDHKHAGREFRLMGLPRPAPSVSIDLWKVGKKDAIWASHKMQYLAEQLQFSLKMQHHGFLLWRECMGDYGPERQKKAWAIMRRYNKQDLRPTEDLFEEFLPDLTNLPAPELYLDPVEDDGPPPPCANLFCRSENVQRRGYRMTKTRRYARYQCQDCGRWFSKTRSDLGVSTT